MVVKIQEAQWTTPIQLSTKRWSAVAYGNHRWVVVSNNIGVGYRSVSEDGVNWTTPVKYTGLAGRNDIAFGQNKFIAVGEATYLSITEDGVNWTDKYLGTSQSELEASEFVSIAYGGNRFVVVGASGYVTTSTDGVTWNKIKKVGTSRWNSVTYGGGKFVAVSNSGYISSTTDGATWTTPVQVGTSSWDSIAYGNGKFVAVNSNKYSTTSTDGITWSTPVQDNSIRWGKIVFVDGQFIATCSVNYTSGYITTSTDGITWTTPIRISNIPWNNIVGDNKGQLVMASNNGYMVSYILARQVRYLLTTKSENIEKKYILATKKQQINSNYLQVVGSPEISDDLIVSNLGEDNYLSIPPSKIQLYGEIPTSSEYTYFKLSKTPVIEITYNTNQPILFRIPALKINYSDKIGNVWVSRTTEIDFYCNVNSVKYTTFQEAYLIPGNTYVFEPGYLGVRRGTSSSGKQIVFNYYCIFYGTGIFRNGSSTIKLEKAQGGALVMTKPYYPSYETYSNRIDSIQLLTENDLQIGASDAEFNINLKNSYIRTETGQNIPLGYDIKYYA